MKQGTVSFASFLPRFERALAEAGGSTWADKAKIAFLEGTLNQDTRRTLVTIDQPTLYTQFVQKLLQIDGKLNALRDHPRERERPRRPSNEMDWEPTQTTKVSKTRPLSDEERQRYMEQGRCFGCGEKGHIRPQCPKKGGSQKATTRIKKKKISKPKIEIQSDEEEEGEESVEESESDPIDQGKD